MKVGRQHVARMYTWTIVLILILDAYSSYLMGKFPYSLLLATFLTVALEIAVRFIHLKHLPKIPISGIITGLIIGSVAPFNTAYLAVAIACVAAVLSKYIRLKSVNIFNPSAMGLLVGLGVLSLGPEWWAASSLNAFGIMIPLAAILVISAYQARRLVVGLSFVVVSALITFLMSPSIGILASFLSVNYFFSLLMAAEPRTSPIKNRAQLLFGTGIAVIYSILAIVGFGYASIGSLLLGNLGYALYKRFG